MRLEGCLTHQADITQGNDTNSLDLCLEVVVLKNRVHQFDTAIKIWYELILQVGGHVLEETCCKTLTHDVVLAVLVEDRRLDDHKDRLGAIDIFSLPGVEHAIEDENDSSTIGWIIGDFLEKIQGHGIELLIDHVLETHKNDLDEASEVVDQNLFLSWAPRDDVICHETDD